MERTFRVFYDVNLVASVDIPIEVDNNGFFQDEAQENYVKEQSWVEIAKLTHKIDSAIVKKIKLREVTVYGDDLDDEGVEDPIDAFEHGEVGASGYV